LVTGIAPHSSRLVLSCSATMARSGRPSSRSSAGVSRTRLTGFPCVNAASRRAARVSRPRGDDLFTRRTGEQLANGPPPPDPWSVSYAPARRRRRPDRARRARSTRSHGASPSRRAKRPAPTSTSQSRRSPRG